MARVLEKKTHNFQVKLGDTDRDRLHELAKLEETTASALVRRLLLERARELGVEQ